jgi:hypothetical protein
LGFSPKAKREQKVLFYLAKQAKREQKVLFICFKGLYIFQRGFLFSFYLPTKLAREKGRV